MPHWVSKRTTVSLVRSSLKHNSGWACKSRRMAVSAAASVTMESSKCMAWLSVVWRLGARARQKAVYALYKKRICILEESALER